MALSGESAGGRSPWAGGSEGEGSANARTGTSRTGGGPGHWARAAGPEGRNTEVPSGLEHPGQAAKTGSSARGNKADGKGGRRPGPSGVGVRAKEAATEGWMHP